MAAMTNKTENQGTELASFVDQLMDEFSLLSDEKVITDAIRDFGSIDVALGDIDVEIENAIASLGKDRLTKARAALEHSRKNAVRPSSSVEAYQQLADFITSNEGFRKVTLAARNGQGSSEDDATSAIFDLCELREFKQSRPLPKFGEKAKADVILRELGVTKPDDIDVEAIAWHLGAKVRYGRLTQCEARIIGSDDVAMITVDDNVSPPRQRFSICHELGHWIYHRGQTLCCQAGDIELPNDQSNNLERVADRFASELLMPSYLFVPIAQSLGSPSVRVVQQLSEIFKTSRTAAAIRLVQLSQRPLCLVSHTRNGRRWFARSQALSGNWIPSRELRSESAAFAMIFGKGVSKTAPRCINASIWFTRRDASRFNVLEESFRVQGNEVISLLSMKEEKEFLRQQS
jgi:hypothetical protein